MEGNRVSGEFPTRFIDSSAPANDMSIISAYNIAYIHGKVVCPELRETTPRF